MHSPYTPNLKVKIITILTLALITRLLYLYYVVPTDWIGDSYHHWQIAIYTLKIGLPQGRMWDLKGVEYYWPPLPTLIEASLMSLIGNTSINNMRFLNSLFGSISVIIIYLIGSRYRKGIGLTAAAAMLFFPLTLNTEVLALHEPLMGLFFLLGMYLFLKGKRFYAGTLFGLSYLCHFSVYLTVPVILAVVLLKERKIETLLPFLSGFLLIYLPYMYFLRTQTGDPLYNIRTMIRYIGVSTATMKHPYAKIIGLILVPLGGAILYTAQRNGVDTIESRITSILLGSYMLFWGSMFLFVGAPLSPYEMRYYWIPLVLGILYLSKLSHNLFKAQTVCMLSRSSILFAGISMFLLIALSPTFSELQEPILWDFNAADTLAGQYENGTIISPVPHMTYRLINYWEISPLNILGPIYCPTEPTKKIQWITDNNITLMFWLPGWEAERVFPELSRGTDEPPFYVLEKLGHDRYIYKIMSERRK